jgi:hypothetical protein
MQYTSKMTWEQLAITWSNNNITYTCAINNCIVGNAHGDVVRLVVDEPRPVGHHMRSGTMSANQNASALLDDDPARQTLAERATSAVWDMGDVVDT